MAVAVQHHPKEQRFVANLDGSAAYLTYSFQGDKVLFDHTFVPPQFRGRGVAEALVREGLAEARRQHWKIVPACSYVATFIRRYREFADLVA